MNFRLRDFIQYPMAIKQFHDQLLESQFWTPERLRGWVQERLERTLRLAVRDVPYYRRTLAPHQSRFCEYVQRLDLSELPSISKDTVRQYAAQLRSGVSSAETTVVRTSGTTGTPAEFLVDRSSQVAQFASLWRVLNWAGYSFGDRFVDIRRNPSQAPLIYRDRRMNSLVIPVFHFRRENVPAYLERMRQFNPVLVKSYPSALDLFCRWLVDLGLEYHPKAVLTCAETRLDHQRAIMEEVLRCPLFDFYNHNERAGLISTCEQGTYHIHEEYSFIELVGDDTQEPGAGRRSGEVVTTTLHNDVMPLIRYHTGDLVTASATGSCSCGRSLRTVARINGRVTDVVVTPDGRHLAGLEHAFMQARGVHRSQIVQDTVDEIVVNIVKAPSYTASDGELIERGLRSFVGDMRITFQYVDTIRPGDNGKVQFVISKPGRASIGRLSANGA
jgi:phenylacetate-CoA ligase